MRFKPNIFGDIAVASEGATMYRIVTGDPIFYGPAATHDPKNNGCVLLIRNGRHCKIAGFLVNGSDCSLTDDL